MSYDFLLHFSPEAAKMSEGGESAALKKACQEFESFFWEILLKEMRKTVPEGGLLGNSLENDLYTSMYHQELSVELSRRGGLGLTELLEGSLEGTLEKHDGGADESEEEETVGSETIR